jgi:hypothetical protein
MEKTTINYKKDKMKKCIGYSGIVKSNEIAITKCSSYVIDDEDICGKHKYFTTLDKKTLKSIKKWFDDPTSKKENISFCKRCRHFVEYDNKQIIATCETCKETKRQASKKERTNIKKCLWFDIKKNECQNNDTGYGYCKYHEYIKDYTDDMKKESKICSKCRKLKYCGTFSTCNTCRK